MNFAPSTHGAPGALVVGLAPFLVLVSLVLFAVGCSRPVDGTSFDERQISADPAYQKFGQACDAGDFGTARLAAVELARHFPANGSAWNCVGYATERIGLASEALRAYRKAVEINPRHAKAWANTGLLEGRHGNLAEEIRCYRRSLKLRPGHARTWHNLAVAAKQAGRTVEAAEAVRQFARLSPPPPRGALGERALPGAPFLGSPESFRGSPPSEPSSPLEFPSVSGTPGPPSPAVPVPVAPPMPPVIPSPSTAPRTGSVRNLKGEEPAPKASSPAPMSVEDCRYALGKKTEDPALWNDLGVAQAAAGALEESLDSFRRAARLAATHKEPRWNLTRAELLLAEKNFKQGRSAQGLAHLREAATASPEPVELRVILVKLGVAMGDLLVARENAAAVPREGEAAGGAWLALGLALAARGQDRDALDPLQGATECLPNQPAAWHALGVVQARAGRLVEAAASLSRAAKLDPSDGVVLYHQGLVEARRKDWKRAALFLRAAARRLPSGEVLDAALAAEEKGGSLAAVATTCREALARDPKNAAAWRVLALASEGMGDFVAAAGAWAKVANLLPSDAESRNRLGVALAHAGRDREAQDAFEKGLALAPEDSILLGNLTLVLRRTGRAGDVSQALAHLRRVDPARAAEISAWLQAVDRRERR
jgi:Flp pilus assembly protein TadD